MFELSGQPVCCQPLPPRVSRALYYTFRVLFFYSHPNAIFLPLLLAQLILSMHFAALLHHYVSVSLSMRNFQMSPIVAIFHGWYALRLGLWQSSSGYCTYTFQHKYFCDSLISLFVRIVFSPFLLAPTCHASRYATFDVFQFTRTKVWSMLCVVRTLSGKLFYLNHDTMIAKEKVWRV